MRDVRHIRKIREMAKNDKTEYLIDENGEGGFVIKKILGSSPHFIVYFTDNDGLRWELDDDKTPVQFPECISKFDDLQTLIISSGSKGDKRKTLLASLGRALHASSISKEKDAALKCFDEIGIRIKSEIALHSRIYYVASSMISLLIQ